MIKKLTVIPLGGMNDSSLNTIEALIGKKFNMDFRFFMKGNAGFSHRENTFIDFEKTIWTIIVFENFSTIYKLTDEFASNGWGKMIPFASELGGWHFCLCMEEKDHGSIYVNRWTDHLPEGQFLKIADSFEEFINGLKTEEELDL